MTDITSSHRACRRGAYVVDVVDADGTSDRRTVSPGATCEIRFELVAGLAVADELVVL